MDGIAERLLGRGDRRWQVRIVTPSIGGWYSNILCETARPVDADDLDIAADMVLPVRQG